MMRPFVLVLAAAAGFFALFGCAALPEKTKPSPKETELVIPDLTSAQEQYTYARAYAQMQVISGEEKKRKAQLDKQIQCWEAVIRRYPENRVHTPLAKLEVADCYSRQNDLTKALTAFETIAEEYTDREYIRVRALLSKGRVMDKQGKYQEAKDVYRDVFETYGSSADPNVRELVKKAREAYMRVREQPKTKTGSFLKR